MTNEKRLEVEKTIVRKYVQALLAAGYNLSVFDGEETTVKCATSVSVIMNALQTTDEDSLIVYNADAVKLGKLYFVYGNEPGEVLCDYSTALEDVIAPVNTYAEQWT